MQPDSLFRTLAQAPRPRALLEFDLKPILGISLSVYVQALGSWQILPGIAKSAIMALSLVNQDFEPIFSSVAQLEDSLIESEYRMLFYEVNKALEQISPMIGYCNQAEIMKRLIQGAQHPTNYIITRSLGNCTSYEVVGDRVITREHPETFFGVPRWSLVDGQWMAYWAAHKVYSENLFGDAKEKEKAAIQAHRQAQTNPLKDSIKGT